jgi:hypothetical protein
MMLKRLAVLTAAPVAVLGALAFGTGAAHAAPVPTTVTATTHISNRPDSGNDGTWAYDHLARTLTVTKAAIQPSSTVTAYTATVTDTGSFSTVGGAGTPNQFVPGTKILHNGVKGDISGGISYTVTAPAADTLTGTVPATENDNFSTTGAGFTSTADWPELAFASKTGVTVTEGSSWSWKYSTACESWTDSAANGDGNTASDGNITGQLCYTPHPYVYNGHVITVSEHNATVGWSDSAHGWPSANHCVQVQIFGYGFSVNGSPHIGFTCDNGNPAANIGYLRDLAAGHTYALRVQPAEGVYGNNHPIPGTDDHAHITVVTTK